MPTGVAVVYQNNWINPVLTKIDKASVREIPYENKIISSIMSIKTARTNLLKMVMQAWFDSDREKEEYLMDALKTLELSKNERQKIAFIIKESSSSNVPVFSKDDKVQVAEYVSTILDIKDEDFYGINSLEELEAFVRNRIDSVDDDGIDSILYLLTFMETG